MLLTVPLSNLDLYGLNPLFSFTFFFLKFMNLITNHRWVTFRRYCKGVYSTSPVKRVSTEGLLMGARDTEEEELESWGIELQKVHLYKQLKAGWYSVQMFPISKNSLESHLLLTSTNSAYKLSSIWRIAQIKKIVLVKEKAGAGFESRKTQPEKGLHQTVRSSSGALICKIKVRNNWQLLNATVQENYFGWP